MFHLSSLLLLKKLFLWLFHEGVHYHIDSSHPVDTGRKLNVHKTFRRRPGRLLNVLCTFNLRPVSTGQLIGRANQWIGFYLRKNYVKKEFREWLNSCFKSIEKTQYFSKTISKLNHYNIWKIQNLAETAYPYYIYYSSLFVLLSLKLHNFYLLYPSVCVIYTIEHLFPVRIKKSVENREYYINYLIVSVVERWVSQPCWRRKGKSYAA